MLMHCAASFLFALKLAAILEGLLHLCIALRRSMSVCPLTAYLPYKQLSAAALPSTKMSSSVNARESKFCGGPVQLMEEWAEKEAERQTALEGVAGGMEDANATADEPQFVAYVPLPDQKEIEARVVEKKKAELLAKYSTPALQAAQREAKALLSGQ